MSPYVLSVTAHKYQVEKARTRFPFDGNSPLSQKKKKNEKKKKEMKRILLLFLV